MSEPSPRVDGVIEEPEQAPLMEITGTVHMGFSPLGGGA